MKYLILAFFIFLLSTSLTSQNTVPKYVLVEHFTNTWCPICAGRNPDFYATLKKYEKNVHQISIHPPYPYSGCPLYQYNKSENQDRSNFYNIQGTPSVVLNGGNVIGGIPLLSEDALKKEIVKTSPLAVIVSESGTGNSRVASITLKPNGIINGDLRLIAIIVERNLRFTASNGELDHYNVMRKFLTPVTGQKISITDNSVKKVDFNYKDSTGWKPEEAYVLAFVQNASNNEVINSGTKFDNLTTPFLNTEAALPLKVYPTLAKEQILIDIPTIEPYEWNIINVHGQIMIKGRISSGIKIASLAITSLSQGLYWIKMKSGAGQSYVTKFLKS